MQDGIILIDKPSGMTSFGVVARVRRVLSQQEKGKGVVREADSLRTPSDQGKPSTIPHKRKRVKVGHTGTLDPFATGLMILVIGKECRNAQKYSKLDKEYLATIRLGHVSSTGDPEGVITPFVDAASTVQLPEETQKFKDSKFLMAESQVSSESVPLRGVSARPWRSADGSKPVPASPGEAPTPSATAPSRQVVEAALKQFTGQIEQTPPQFSAIKVGGQRAYKLARQGEKFEIPKRTVKVYELELVDYDYPSLKVRAKVSSGTYIRSLAEDIGQALGTGAYCRELRRTKVADWSVDEAQSLGDLGIDN